MTANAGKKPGFKPLPAIAALVLVVAGVAAGTEQVKLALEAQKQIDAYQAEALVALPPEDKALEAANRHAVLGGKFQNHLSLSLPAGKQDGVEGNWLVTPLDLYTGEVVYVLRGFVAQDAREPVDQPTGTVAASGILKPYADMKALNPKLADLVAGISEMPPYPLLLVAEDAPNHSPWPKPVAARLLENGHWLYAFAAFLLALGGIGVYVKTQKNSQTSI